MHVGVGSGNPVKRRAAQRVVPGAWSVGLEPVDSGVSDQPFGHPETRRGAETRAKNVLRAGEDYGLGIGLEGGVARYDAVEGLWLIMWGAATDGDRIGRGAGPSLRLPDRIADRVAAGEELGPVMDDVLGEEGVARDRGAAGVLTGGGIDRAGALGSAAAGALGPFVTDQYGTG